MNNQYANKISSRNVLLTGATGGIGQAMATLLHRLGANLVLVGRNKDKLEYLQRKLMLSNLCEETTVTCIQADITKSEDRGRLRDALQEMPVSLDILINNAGVSEFSWLEHTSSAELEHILMTNTLAPMQLTQLLLPQLKHGKTAQIINVGSTFGSIGFPGYSAYCASKYALRGFSQSLARELADTQVVVKYLSPRATDTSINSSHVKGLNKALNTACDSPETVAKELINLLVSNNQERYIGWPERLFVKINQVFPGIVGKSIVKQLPVIKRFALKS